MRAVAFTEYLNWVAMEIGMDGSMCKPSVPQTEIQPMSNKPDAEKAVSA